MFCRRACLSFVKFWQRRRKFLVILVSFPQLQIGFRESRKLWRKYGRFSVRKLLDEIFLTYLESMTNFQLLFFPFNRQLTGQWGKGEDHFYFCLPFPPAHKHSDMYLQLCMWDDYRIFLIARLLTTRMLLDEIYHLFELPFDWLMLW